MTKNTDRVGKAYLVDYLMTEKGFSRSAAQEAVNGTMDAITAALAAKKTVIFANIGTLRPVHRPTAERRNPATGGKVTVEAHDVIRWTASPTLTDFINGRTTRTTLSTKAPKGTL